MGWRWRVGVNTMIQAVLLFAILTISGCDGARRTAQRRQVTELYSPAPSMESLQKIAEAMGAAGFEAYTEGKQLVKRLIPAESEPDLDVVEHQGVIGKAGVDFPAFPSIPTTGFNCKNVPTGYYADLETDCQVFHICDTSRKISFLCPNGTIFSQSHLICDWWFKVDCASAPALYESSAEYYSNEQKKTQRVTQTLSKNQDLQQLGAETNVRMETRHTPIPSTTERLRHRQRQTDIPPATAKTYQALFPDNFGPTQRTAATTAFENRRQGFAHGFTNHYNNIQPRSTAPTYTDPPARSTAIFTRSTADYSLKEMQVAAETASFANNNNRQFLQDLHNKNYRPYPVYTPNVPKPKPKTNPVLTTLYDIRDKQSSQAVVDSTSTTTQRPTLVTYTKSYSTIGDKQEPYTRPGVSSLKRFLQREKNKNVPTTTYRPVHATARSIQYEKINKVTIDTKDHNSFESATKIPETTIPGIHFRHDAFSNQGNPTTDISYKERRERLLKKLNLDTTEATVPTAITDKNYSDQPNRPGLIVPPSLTPKTLHSLAIYYATALDNLSTTPPPEEGETSTPTFAEYEAMEEVLPALFSPNTINKYSSLFGQEEPSPELLEEIRADPNGTYNEIAEDLAVMQSQNPLATSPQIRELAQVFTHALSAYLQDPVQFRKVLSDIRPTHPSFGDLLTTTEESINTEPTTTINEDDDEILGFSDDNKVVPPLTTGVREPKALELANYQEAETTTSTPERSTETMSSTHRATTPRNPFRCCGKISAHYTTTPAPASPTTAFSYAVAANINTNNNNNNNNEASTTTENDYAVPKYGGFQNNALTLNDNYNPYRDGTGTEGKPLTEYVEVTNLPTAWGVDTSGPTTASGFESKRIRTTTFIPTTTPTFFTETESVEFENEEELQRAHSQSFAAPQGNSLRQGKKINLETKNLVKKPAEELEAPTLPETESTTVQTTTQPTTTTYKTTETEPQTTTPTVPDNIYFTSPDDMKTTNVFAWSSTFGNWHSTVIDPITLNDGLSPDENAENTYVPTATTGSDFTSYTATEQTASSTSNVDVATHEPKTGDRLGRLLRDPSSTEPNQDITTISETVVEKAKEIMNSTTTEKLMNVMKKTKSKTVKRLILLLIQTCDDDHNTTAEASKKALLDALMAVSQKDMEEIAQEEEQVSELPTTTDNDRTTVYRRTDRVERQRGERRGKSLNFDPSAINSLSNPTSTSTTERVKTTTEELHISTTTSPVRTTSRRGGRKYFVRGNQNEVRTTTKAPEPTAEARVATTPVLPESKTVSDTRALELLRSLYTIAARWG